MSTQTDNIRADTPGTLIALGREFMSRGQQANAAACYRRVPDMPGANPQELNLAGNLLLDLGDGAGAAHCYGTAAIRDPGRTESHCNLGLARHILGDLQGAIAAYHEALRLSPGQPEALAGLASVLERMGDVDQAYTLIAPSIVDGSAHPHAVLIYAQLSHRYGRERHAVMLLRKLVEKPDLPPQYRLQGLFALGKLLDSLEDYEAAFLSYQQANALKQYPYAAPQHREAIDQLKMAFSREFMARAPRAASPSQTPLFIIGMPRSGTSLVEQILASHPGIYGAGELEDITRLANTLTLRQAGGKPYPHCVHDVSQELLNELSAAHLARLATLSHGATRVTDKLPGNVYNLGLIELLFPGSRVIHVVRNPLDTCLSCYFQNFVSGHYYAYDLTHLGAYYRNYLYMMEHWNQVLRLPILEVHYEDLVADQEKVSRQLISFCGMEWSDDCLRFAANRRSVATASYQQVRQPLYTKSVGRWRHYERFLAPLKAALGHPAAP